MTHHVLYDSFEQDCLFFGVRVLHPEGVVICVRVARRLPRYALSGVGMAQPEKKLLWHPTRSNRFIVGGGNPGQIKVYDWDGKSDITEVTALGDLQHMKVSHGATGPTMEFS